MIIFRGSESILSGWYTWMICIIIWHYLYFFHLIVRSVWQSKSLEKRIFLVFTSWTGHTPAKFGRKNFTIHKIFMIDDISSFKKWARPIRALHIQLSCLILWGRGIPGHLLFTLVMSQKTEGQNFRYIWKIFCRPSLSDHFAPIFIVRNLPRLLLLGFEVRDDVIFSQSGGDCPLIFCPVIPHPTVYNNFVFINFNFLNKHANGNWKPIFGEVGYLIKHSWWSNLTVFQQVNR